jgi:putative IMPACT (imprinted ancient) family translation regulator
MFPFASQRLTTYARETVATRSREATAAGSISTTEAIMAGRQRTADAGGGDGDSYLTLAGIGRSETRVQRSRFLAVAAPAPTPEAARERAAEEARRHHDARHVCYAWRGGRGADAHELRHDAGEPTGTAGEPILQALRGAGVTEAVVARAYAEAAAGALAAAPRRTVRLGRVLELVFPYAHQKTVARLLQRRGGRTRDEQYAELVRWRVWLPLADADRFASEVRDATAGATKIKAPTREPEP